MSRPQTVLVTGGGGYVGSVLVPKLLANGHHVRVLDLYLYGEDVLAPWRGPDLQETKGDIRDSASLMDVLAGCDAVIHLACISNDPSFELDRQLGRSINYDAFLSLLDLTTRARVRRFIYASTSSVYGIKAEENVTEDLPLEPLTDYSKYKAMCEEALLAEDLPGFTTVIIRSATVCGYSPRLRLDLTINLLTSHAVNTGRITVFGGSQKRPNIHIADITDLYVTLLEVPDELIHRQIFNAGYENHTVSEIAEMVRDVVIRSRLRKEVEITTAPTNDTRSYHISSEKIKRQLGFKPRHTLEDAIRGLCQAFADGRVPNPMTDIRYDNIKTMQAKQLR